MGLFSTYFSKRLMNCRPAIRWLVCLILAWPGHAVFGVTLSCGLDRDQIKMGESCMLTLTYVGGAPGTPPTIPPVTDLKIVPVGESSEIVFINGQQSSK